MDERAAVAFAAAIRQRDPQMLEEMDGIAAGAGVDPAGVYALNANPEALGGGIFGCTSVGVSMSEDGPLLGKNCDLGFEGGSLHIASVSYSDGLRLWRQGFPGRIWTTGGMNHHGFCLGGSSVNVKPSGPPRLEDTALLASWRLLRSCRNVIEARAMTEKENWTSGAEGMAWLVVDKDGTIASVEQAPGLTAFVKDHNGFAFTTNRFRSPEASPRGDEGRTAQARLSDRSSRERDAVLVNSWRGMEGGVESMEKLLKSHGRGGTGALCRHGFFGRGGTTTLSIVWCPRDLQAWARLGRPCAGPLSRLGLSKAFRSGSEQSKGIGAEDHGGEK